MKTLTKKQLLDAFNQCASAMQSSGSAQPLQQFAGLLQYTEKPADLAYFSGKLLKKFPKSANVLIALAQHFQKSRRLDAALVVLTEVRATQKPNPNIDLIVAQLNFSLGQIAEAKKVLDISRRDASSAEQLFALAAQIGESGRDWTYMVEATEAWLKAVPGSVQAAQQKSHALFELYRFPEAVEAFRPVLNAGRSAEALSIMGRLCLAAEFFNEAEAALREALMQAPDNASLHTAMSDVYKVLGQIDKSLEHNDRALSADPDSATAYIQRATLKQGKLSAEDTATMVRLVADKNLPAENRAALAFALGDRAHGEQEYDNAFQYYADGNRMNAEISAAEGLQYNHGILLEEIETVTNTFSDHSEAPGAECETPVPVFIVGMPRSGTTLLESILAAHSQVYGAGELRGIPVIYADFVQYALRHSAAKTRSYIETKKQDWRQQYLDGLPALGNASFVVDKQPTNFHSVGLIRIIFPEARIVHIKRPALETCFSIFRHNFSKFWSFAHDLKDIGQYYSAYARLSRAWGKLYPEDQFSLVRYTDLIENQIAETKRVLEICGLPFEEACLSPHLALRPVTSHSAVQVREPVSAKFSGRAEHYKNHLKPLLDIFEDNGLDPQSGELIVS